MLEPFKGRVYDPAMGMLVKSRNAEARRIAEFLSEHLLCALCVSAFQNPPHNKTKQKRSRGAAAFRDRTGEVLFIDARKLGYMVDRLIETLRRYHNRSIETAQVIEEMIEMAKDFQERLKRDEELGLNPDELAFYDALANNESAVRELGDAILKKIASEFTLKLRASTTVDWQVRDSVRAKLRNLVRRLLRKYKVPPDQPPKQLNWL